MPHPTDPSLTYSQNFLRDPRLVEYLLDRSSIDRRDLVYEIGPGTGIITERLARCCRSVVAIEKDRELAAYLRLRFRGQPRVAIHAADFLQFPLPLTPFKVFANIPFAATSAIVTRLTARPEAASLDSYLVVQREAADRFLGSPRGTHYAALLFPWFAAEISHAFQPNDFRPVPHVDSVLLRLYTRRRALVQATDAGYFRDFVSCIFTAPRPTIRRALRLCLGRPLAQYLVRAVDLDPDATPSMIPGILWILLFEHLKDAGGLRAYQQIGGAEEKLRRQQDGLQKRHRAPSHWPEHEGSRRRSSRRAP